MASSALPISQSPRSLVSARHLTACRPSLPAVYASSLGGHLHRLRVGPRGSSRSGLPLRRVVVYATTTDVHKKRQAAPGPRDRGFVDEMRAVAMRLHTRDQAKEGEKEADAPPVAKWEPSVEGYLRFLVDSKLVYDTLETIVQEAKGERWVTMPQDIEADAKRRKGRLAFVSAPKEMQMLSTTLHLCRCRQRCGKGRHCSTSVSVPMHIEQPFHRFAFVRYDKDAEFRNTGLERSEKLAKDLEWFKDQGHTIPEPSSPGVTYASYLEELSKNDPQAFICHLYNIYFAHTAGGRMIGRKVAEKILDNKELEFYQWDGDLSQMLQNVREKLNRVASVR
ncbi:hypothetical protein GW17_00021173 [Ensete ventricosum]|nr:hypothetical protein GW17_00021173 [Ensete ventricosum]